MSLALCFRLNFLERSHDATRARIDRKTSSSFKGQAICIGLIERGIIPTTLLSGLSVPFGNDLIATAGQTLCTVSHDQ